MGIRLGIVGCGAISEDMHIPTALAVDEVQLVALVDSNKERCATTARKHGIVHFACNLGDVAEYIDAVIIATPPHVRLQLAKQAFQLGLHVFCEKPLANSVAECEAITGFAKEAGRVLAVCHMFRFYPVRRKLLELVNQHELGKISKVIATEGKPYTWPAVTGYTVRREMSPGGVMINAGIHTLDALLWWFGDPINIQYEDDSAGGLESNLRLWMEFPNQVNVFFRQSRTCHLPYKISIEAEHGSLFFATNSVSQYTVRKNGVEQKHACDDLLINHKTCWIEELKDFVDSIVSGRQPLVTGEEGTRVIRLIESCYSMKHSRPLPSKVPIPGLTW